MHKSNPIATNVPTLTAMPYRSVDMEAAEGLEFGTVSVEVSEMNTTSGETPRQRAHTWTHTHNDIIMKC